MSLYDGWNGLQIGQVVNDGMRMRQKREEDRWNALGQLLGGQGKLADSIYGYYKENEADEKARRAGLSVANGMGMQNADEVSAGMRGNDFLKYVLGMKDTMDSETRAENTYQNHWKQNAEREDRVRNAGYERDDITNERTLKQNATLQSYKSLMDNYNFLTNKAETNGILSRKDAQALEDVKKGLTEFKKSHPEYDIPDFGDPAGNGAGTGGATDWTQVPFEDLVYSEDFTNKLQSLYNNGKVDPKALGEFIDKAQYANKWETIVEANKDLLKLLAKTQTGGKLLREKGNLEFGGSRTKQDVDKEIRRQQFLNKAKKQLEALDKWSKGMGDMPELSADVEKYLREQGKYGSLLGLYERHRNKR